MGSYDEYNERLKHLIGKASPVALEVCVAWNFSEFGRPGYGSAAWVAYELERAETAVRVIKEAFTRGDCACVQDKYPERDNADLERTRPCTGGCGRTLPVTELVSETKPTCADCYERAQARESMRTAKRGIRSALSRARAARRLATLTQEEWARTVSHFNDTCAYCGDKWYLVNLVLPLELGGGATVDNCVPACFRCNTLKRRQTLDELILNAPNEEWRRRLEAIHAWLANVIKKEEH